MGNRPGQRTRLERERRAPRKLPRLLSQASALAALPIFMGTLMRFSSGQPWSRIDWSQVAALSALLIVAVMTAISLILRQGRRTLALNAVTITAVAIALVCSELLLDLLGRGQALTINYGSYLLMIAAAVGCVLALIFVGSRE